MAFEVTDEESDKDWREGKERKGRDEGGTESEGGVGKESQLRSPPLPVFSRYYEGSE